jgi:hypothetical protein
VCRPECARCDDDDTSAGNSSSLAIICILRCRARKRPFTKRCLAAMHRMWSSKINRAANSGLGGGRVDAAGPPVIEVGRRTVTCKQRLSSLSPLTSTSYKPISKTGRYSKQQYNYFSDKITINLLSPSHNRHLKLITK